MLREVERERVDADLRRAAEARRKERAVGDEETRHVMMLARRFDDGRARVFAEAHRSHRMHRRDGDRVRPHEAEIEHLQQLVGESGAKALKFRLGGRMSRNVDSLPGRTEALIPLVRKTFGDDFTLLAIERTSGQ